jgi:MGT family glycosyltransferase
MYRIVFFSIDAVGHTNPTLPLVKELVSRGNEVWYYSFRDLRDRVESTGARYVECDGYLPPLSDRDAKRVGKDFTLLVGMSIDTTLAMDATVTRELEAFRPDCIVSDSVCTWGRLFAKKLGVPYVCSTTTFAYNQHTAKLLKRGLLETFYTVAGMPKVVKRLQELKPLGYPVDRPQEVFANDNATNTLVYTSREFQPMADTFSDRYAFVGTSVSEPTEHLERSDRKTVYVSLGTVLDGNVHFYRDCISALKGSDLRVIVSVGRSDVSALDFPSEFIVRERVDQLAVLEVADCFVTHSGMNSVSESLYYGVPMVLYPQNSEESAVTDRAVELGAGVRLRNADPKSIRSAVFEVLGGASYRDSALRLSETLKRSGGSRAAADYVESVAKGTDNGKE